MNRIRTTIAALTVATLLAAGCSIEAPNDPLADVATTATPAETPVPEPANDPGIVEQAIGLTPAQGNAVISATSYLAIGSWSREGLIEQLEFEQYETADATVAVDSLDIDWTQQAIEHAADYLELDGFSCQGLIDQLEFEGHSTADATAGATAQGIC